LSKNPLSDRLGIVILILSISGVFVTCNPTVEQNYRFELVRPEQSGLDFTNTVEHLPDQNIIEYMYHYNGGGVAVGDINNDGLEDIYLSANQGSDHLYINKGDMTFEDISVQSGILDTEGWSTGVTMTDINQDGWLDIYVCQVGGYKSYEGKNKLFINQGDLTFVEQADDYNLGRTGFFTQAAFLDYDQDGDDDLFLLNHAVHTPRSYQPVDKLLPRDLRAGDFLFRNDLSDSSFTFTDVTEFSGIHNHARGYGLGLVVADINEDGWLDIYVGNDFHENDYLYINQKDGTFKDELIKWLPHTTQFTMGADIQDINQDGAPDIFTVDMMPRDRSIRMKSGGEDPYKLKEAKFSFGYHPQVARNNLQLNKRDHSFGDIASFTGTYATDWSWSALMEDFDNNGLSDIFISNGIYKRPNDLDYINFLSNYNLNQYEEEKQDSIEKILIDQMPTLKIPNAMFAQLGYLNFQDVSKDWNLDKEGYSGATALADFDLDGDLDLVINNVNQKVWLYRNHTSSDSDRSYLQLDIASSSHQSVTGTSVTVYAGDEQWTKNVGTVRGFHASSSRILHFGLGNKDHLDSITVNRQGKESTLLDIEINKKNKIDLDSLKLIQNEPRNNAPIFDVIPTSVSISASNFNDFNREPLIPFRQSILRRPAIAVDFDRDGVRELLVGGGSGYSAKLYKIENGMPVLLPRIKAFEQDQFFDDAAVEVADFNMDGHLDLYIASGGNRHPEGSTWLEDRLYLGDGKLGFVRKKMALPRTNASVVRASDMDHDGDMDLFIGTYNFPGAYGYSPASFLLENKNYEGLTISQVLESGMVTDAQWFYTEESNYPMLATVGEWEPLKIWEMKSGQWSVSKMTKEFNTYTGWFRSLEVSDINDDGKMDFLLGNIGQNMFMKASKEQPVRLYLDDFDQNGQSDPIISYFLDDKEVPLASKDMLTGQIPLLKKDFVSYRKFAQTSGIKELLSEMYDPASIIIKSTTDFRHLAFMSKDSGYSVHVLPVQSQLSSINDFIHVDINNDGMDDLLTGGNTKDQLAMIGQQDANAFSIFSGDSTLTSLFQHQAFINVGDVQVNQILEIDADHWMLIPAEGKALMVSKRD
jgi:hypothetical protein